ncbi:hypothetical protein V8F20_011192 [Naviculisporaceae sp. PSN 640]
MTLLTRVFSTLATFTLPISVLAQQTPSNNDLTFPSTLEMDMLFPQNTTYKLPPSDIFPLVFAIQNVSALYRAISALETAQNFTPGAQIYPHVTWHVDAYRDNGRLPGYVDLEHGKINLTDSTFLPAPENKNGDFAIYTAIVNMTAILEMDSGKVARPEFRYVVTYYVQVQGVTGVNGDNMICPGTGEYGSAIGNVGIGRVIFNLDRPQLDDYLPEDQLAEARKQALPVDVMESIPECPEFVTFVDVLPNITAPETGEPDRECPVFFDGRHKKHDPRANPCALKVDQEILSAVSREVKRLAMPTGTSTGEVSTSTSTGMAGLATVRPMQTALAAACVLCGLAL